MGLGMGYIDVRVMDYGIGFFIFGLILEIPAFYLVFKHKGKNVDQGKSFSMFKKGRNN